MNIGKSQPEPEGETSFLSARTLPLVSVIIPCFNRAHYLGEAIESVLEQTYTNLECIIVDDGSTDNTRQLCEALMSKDARVKYLYKSNGGVSSARNLGIEQAQGEWIQFLDSDDWLHKDKIRFQLNCLNPIENGDIVFYSDYELVYEETNQHVTKLVGSLTREELLKKLLLPAGIPHICLLFQKTVFNKLRFNETFKSFEDVKLELDLVMEGVSFIYTPIIGFFYRRHQSNVTGKGWTSSIQKDGVIQYLQVVQDEYKSLQDLCKPRISVLLMQAIEEKDQERFDRILNIIQMPASLYGIKFKDKEKIKSLYKIRLFIPFLRTLLTPLRRNRFK